MKILSLGLDNSVLDKQSALAGRILEYGQLVNKYFVIVPSQEKQNVKLSDDIEAFGSGGKNKLFQLLNIYKLSKKLINKEKFDIITVQDQYYLAFIGYLLKKKFKIGLEIQIHGFEKFKGLRKLIAMFVLPRANAVRAVSQRVKNQLIKEFGVKENKITVVPIYSEIPTDSPLLRGRERGGGNFIFLTVGRLVPIKNINLQIEAISEVVKTYPKTELWVIGDGPEKEKLKLEITRLQCKLASGQANSKLEDEIKLFGYKNNLEEFYNNADCFLLTSDYEGWGLVVIEAASFGLPIIMTDVGCAGEVIKNNESGLIIPIGDKEKLVENMIRLVDDKNLRDKLGENAQRAVEKLPDKEKTLKLYKKSWEKARK